MILKIMKKAPSITGKKFYPVGKEVYVTDPEYAKKLLDEGYAKKLDERFSFMKEIRKARKENKVDKLKDNE
jgi:flagellum-specific peptidoglycan hydrolase FlgJ